MGGRTHIPRTTLQSPRAGVTQPDITMSDKGTSRKALLGRPLTDLPNSQAETPPLHNFAILPATSIRCLLQRPSATVKFVPVPQTHLTQRWGCRIELSCDKCDGKNRVLLFAPWGLIVGRLDYSESGRASHHRCLVCRQQHLPSPRLAHVSEVAYTPGPVPLFQYCKIRKSDQLFWLPGSHRVIMCCAPRFL